MNEKQYTRADGKDIVIYEEIIQYDDGRNHLEQAKQYYIIENNKKVLVNRFGFAFPQKRGEKPKVTIHTDILDELDTTKPIIAEDGRTVYLNKRAYYTIRKNKKVYVEPAF